MKKTIALISLSLGLTLGHPSLLYGAGEPLVQVQPRNNSLGVDEQLWQMYGTVGDRGNLIKSIDHSLTYLKSKKAVRDYENYPVTGITQERIVRSLRRFRVLLINSPSAEEFQAAVEREFVFYKSVGNNRGEVIFTGYFEPIYEASPVPTAEYRYPLYRRPANLESTFPKPHPTRAQLQGVDGLGRQSPLAGNELVWLRDRFEAYLVEIQGSARLRFPDGRIMGVKYNGNTDYTYTSIGRQMIKDKVCTEMGELSLPVMIECFHTYPKLLDKYLPLNNRFIFFQETENPYPVGNLGVPVTAERSIATDYPLMPPGALALIRTRIPYYNQRGGIETRFVSRYVLDQDTGGAIKGPGRVDIFIGTGPTAGDRAGVIHDKGELYYLLLKN